MLLPPGLEVDPQILLSLLAEAYTNRNRLRKPARVVAANLREGRQPSRKFLLDPRTYLPAEFVRKLYKVLAVSEPEYERDATEADEAELPPEIHNVGGSDAVTNPAPPSKSARLWRQARDELERSLPKASYESYVRPLAAVDYDAEEGQLFLEAPDGQSCAWLDSHLKRILERLMVGITGETVRVVFVPPVRPESGGEG